MTLELLLLKTATQCRNPPKCCPFKSQLWVTPMNVCYPGTFRNLPQGSSFYSRWRWLWVYFLNQCANMLFKESLKGRMLFKSHDLRCSTETALTFGCKSQMSKQSCFTVPMFSKDNNPKEWCACETLWCCLIVWSRISSVGGWNTLLCWILTTLCAQKRPTSKRWLRPTQLVLFS